MKILAILSFLIAASSAFADTINPTPATAAPANPVATCTLADAKAPYNVVYIAEVNGTGVLSAQLNPAYASDTSLARFMEFKGITVTVAATTVTVKGTLNSLQGEVALDATMPRNQTTATVIAGQNVTCAVK